jgi:spartin
MSSPYAEAFPLLTLHDVLLATTSGKERGPMVLECVTLSHGSGSSPVDRDVVLVLRVNALEVVVDPRRQITLSDEPGSPRVYTFHGLVDDPAEITLTLPWLANPDSKASSAAADIDTFDQVLTQYANFTPQAAHAAPLANSHTTFEVEDGDEDLRGRLVLVDQVNGEVMGAVGEKGAVRADPMLQKTGHEQDAVVIDMGQDEELGARQMFAQAIPPDQHDAITRTASMLRYIPLFSE